MEKMNEGDAKNVLMAALTRTPYIKGAFVFDTDVDIFNEDEILWALSTRRRCGDASVGAHPRGLATTPGNVPTRDCTRGMIGWIVVLPR